MINIMFIISSGTIFTIPISITITFTITSTSSYIKVSAANVSDDNLLTGVIADATNEKMSFNMETFSGANLIKSYVNSALPSSGESAPSNYTFSLLIGGVRYPGVTQSISSNTTQFVREEWANDPSDGLPWTEAKINAAQVGIEVL